MVIQVSDSPSGTRTTGIEPNSPSSLSGYRMPWTTSAASLSSPLLLLLNLQQNCLLPILQSQGPERGVGSEQEWKPRSSWMLAPHCHPLFFFFFSFLAAASTPELDLIGTTGPLQGLPTFSICAFLKSCRDV